MARWFERTLDRELGPAPRGGRPARESWLRDWPLLLGLVLSAALILGSTTVKGTDAKPAGPSPEASQVGSGITGEVVDVGGENASAPEATASEAPTPAGKPRATNEPPADPASPKGGSATGKSPPSAGKSSGSTASPDGTADAGSSGGTSARGGSRPQRPPASGGGSPSAPVTPGKLVNVTGTSAAFRNGPLSYAFSAPTHTPVVGRRWVLSVSAKRSGRALRGRVKIDILFNGNVVGHAGGGPLVGGRYARRLDWPERSVGHPLVVKTTVMADGVQQSFLYSVRIKRAG